MAFRASIRSKLVIPAVTFSAGTAVALAPKRNAFAEEPKPLQIRVPEVKRKPIYDDDVPTATSTTIHPNPTTTTTTATTTSPLSATATASNDENTLKEGPPTLHPFPSYDNLSASTTSTTSNSPATTSPLTSNTYPNHPSRPTPTDRLAAHIAATRLTLYRYASLTEQRLNAYLTHALDLEQSFTSTIASLAPPPSSGERVLPGLLYVLVAGMAGTIVSRNRTFILRFATPVAFAIGMGYTVVPITMMNVRDLAWKIEERVAPPVVKDMQGRIGREVERVWETGKAHSGMAVARLEEGAKEVREGVEGWISKGK